MQCSGSREKCLWVVEYLRAGDGQGGAACLMGESAVMGYSDSNCYILEPCCGPSTVEGGRNGAYRLCDMMMMMMMILVKYIRTNKLI